MTALQPGRHRIGLACNRYVRERYVAEGDLARLRSFADFTWSEFDEPSSWTGPPPPNPKATAALAEFAAGLDALVVCHGSPRVTEEVVAAAPQLRLVGDLEGDRFAHRFDAAALRARRIAVLDTTHASSNGVAEWALALAILGLRDAGELMRQLGRSEPAFADEETRRRYLQERNRELVGRPVSLIGLGHVGQRLVELLRPFRVGLLVHDPYAPRELADALDVTFAPLDAVLAYGDVVFCLAPLTPRTEGMIGAPELDLLRPGAVLVNVSRGRIVRPEALLARLRRGDVVACLDVFDPEPVPPDAAIRTLPNVVLSPHIAGVTIESRTRFFALMVDELARFFAGHEPRAVLTERVLAGRRATPDPIESPRSERSESCRREQEPAWKSPAQ